MKTWLSWSSGKDSAFSLYQLSRQKMPVSALFTTINEDQDRVAMHSTRLDLLEAQAVRLNLPLHVVRIPESADNETYQNAMAGLIEKAKESNVEQMAFGDLFLTGIRAYRETQLAKTGIKPIFPLWLMPTRELAMEMIESGFKTIITCVDTKQLPAEFVGREFDEAFLHDLPEGVDPCGENGEFHTFVYDCPLFDSPIAVARGDQHTAGQFVFGDLL